MHLRLKDDAGDSGEHGADVVTSFEDIILVMVRTGSSWCRVG